MSGEIAVGRDGRPSGVGLMSALLKGLVDSRAKPIDLGIVPTPTIGIAVRRLELAGGVAVTASHNPQDNNGLKFFSRRGMFLTPDEATSFFALVDGDRPAAGGEEIVDGASPASHGEGIVDRDRPILGSEGVVDGSCPVLEGVGIVDGDLPFPGTDRSGTARGRASIEDHVALIMSSGFVDPDAVRRAGLRIAVDCVNASGSVILPLLLRRLGCSVRELNCDPNGRFVRGPEPIPENLVEFGKFVVSAGADIGLACDPDADRLAIVDETGRAVSEEFTLAIAARLVLSRDRGPVVANVSTSKMIEDVAEEFGVEVVRTPVGEINVAQRMVDVSAAVGGEGNGGVILPAVHMGRDAATAAALIAMSLASESEGASRGSALVSRFARYHMAKHKLAVSDVDSATMLEVMRSEFADADEDLTDGVKLGWPDSWIHVRMSGTEPVVRVISEALTPEGASELVDRAAHALARASGGH